MANAALQTMSIVERDYDAQPRGLFEWLTGVLASIPGKLSPANAERAYVLITRHLEGRGAPSEFRELGEYLTCIEGNLSDERIINILKFPTCVGESRLPFLKLMEERTGSRFGDNVWNMVSRMTQASPDLGQFLHPARRSGSG
jgi:hypothetical protein